VATNHNFRVKNGLEVEGIEIVDSSGVLQIASDISVTTQSTGTNDTTIASTAFVSTAVAAAPGTIDWSTTQAGNIHPDNYTNTTYSVGNGGLTTNDFTDADHTKLNAIEAGADVTDTTNVVAALTAGTNITIAANGTIASSAANVSSDFTHDDLTGFVANEHIDWTGSSAGTIHLTNLPATALTSVQTASSQSAMLALTTEEGDVVVDQMSLKHICTTVGLQVLWQTLHC